MLHRYFLKLAYNGTPFHGWQIQPNAKTIQEMLNQSLSMLLKDEINVIGCGRTDTGVHAREFFAHFDSKTKISDYEDLSYRLNQVLPAEIAIYEVFKVKQDMHARFTALSRTYEYLITKQKNPFAKETMLEFRRPLDLEKMNEACEVLMGFKDFESFSKTGGDNENHLCDLMFAQWHEDDVSIRFEIKANRFLRNMVRAIVGTMLDIGIGKLSIDEFHSIIEAKDRRQASTSAPAHGLYLIHIEYPQGIKDV